MTTLTRVRTTNASIGSVIAVLLVLSACGSEKSRLPPGIDRPVAYRGLRLEVGEVVTTQEQDWVVVVVLVNSGLPKRLSLDPCRFFVEVYDDRGEPVGPAEQHLRCVQVLDSPELRQSEARGWVINLECWRLPQPVYPGERPGQYDPCVVKRQMMKPKRYFVTARYFALNEEESGDSLRWIAVRSPALALSVKTRE